MKLYNLFTEQAQTYKEKIAVKDNKGQISYEDLLQLSIRIKNAILSKQANNTEKTLPIALLFDHSINCIASILGVISTNNSYVPLDKNLPEDRINLILKDSKINTIIYESNTADYIEELLGEDILSYTLINMENLPDSPKNQNIYNEKDSDNESSLFSILYTSGSTGYPKGVIQTEENVLFFVKQFIEKIQIDNNDRISLLTHYNHTVSIIDIFAALLTGAELKLHDVKSDSKNTNDSINWISKEKITVLHTVPTLFRFLVEGSQDKESFASVRRLIIGGEQVTKSDYEKYKSLFADDCKFINLFGSSEVLIATMKVLEKTDEVIQNIIPIGKPYDGITIKLKDENGNEENTHIGEIVYQSQYLLKGYTNYTTDSLVTKAKDRLYYSGDYARYTPSGDLLFIGRKDNQIKINGIRIELADIEATIEKNEKVNKCIVHSFEDKNDLKILCAYIIPAEKSNFDENYLKQELKKQLPDYMIPSYFVEVEDFPTTDSGKIDRSKLIDPRTLNSKENSQENEQFNELEAIILGIWQEVLKVDKIGLDDEFLKLGGDSIKMIMLSAKLKEFFGNEISDTLIFELPTIRLLANELEAKFNQKISETNV